jgi:hypothetical protein
MDSLKALLAPFPSKFISWRPGRLDEAQGMAEALPYIDARAVQVRLDEVMGAANWSVRFHEVVAGSRLVAVRCTLALRIDGHWVEKEDAAPVSLRDDSSAEFAVKGAYSDALKRAAVQWGVGRYLYDYHRQLHPVNERRAFLTPPVLPDEFLPEDERGKQPAQAAPRAPASAAVAPRASTPAEPAAPRPASVEAIPTPQPAAPPAAAAAPARAETQALPATQNPTPVSAAAVEPRADAAPGITSLEELDSAQAQFAKDLLARASRVTPEALRNYVNSPKCADKLSAKGRAYVLAQLAAMA